MLKQAKRTVEREPYFGTLVCWPRRSAEGFLDIHRRSFEEALRAGVLYGTGTDGYGDMVDEIREFTTYGVSPSRAIQAATRDSGRIPAPGADFGTLTPGASADVLVVDGDPLEDLDVLRSVAIVMLRGAVATAAGLTHRSATPPRPVSTIHLHWSHGSRNHNCPSPPPRF